MTEDFSNHPLSITELRSDKTQKASDWTPRDVLISALRDIDSGKENPQFAIVLLGSIDPENRTLTTFYNATPNRYIEMGLISEHIRRITMRDVTGEY